jgi:hypothetical protein
MKNVFFVLAYLFINITMFGQTESALNLPKMRGLYVDKFYSILGDITKEDALLTYAQAHHFNYLALYELHRFDFNNPLHRNRLAAFIKRAKSKYGITQIGATGENVSFFSNNILTQYQSTRYDPLEKFDVLNLEFEYWNALLTNTGKYYCTSYLQQNGLPCGRLGAFMFYIQQLAQIKQLCVAHNLVCETYLGWFTQEEAYVFLPFVDRILLHAYVNKSQIDKDPSVFYNYTRDRLKFIANAAFKPVSVSTIFSSEPSFSGNWLSATSPARTPIEAFYRCQNDFDKETAMWKSKISMIGYQWFTYSFMPKDNIQSLLESDDYTQEIDNQVFKPKISLYPNPASERITIENAKSVEIFNLLGQLVYANKNMEQNTVDIHHFERGTYIVKTDNQIHRFIKGD